MNKNVTWWQAGLLNLASMLLVFFLTRSGNNTDMQAQEIKQITVKKADVEYVDKQDNGLVKKIDDLKTDNDKDHANILNQINGKLDLLIKFTKPDK